MRGEFRTATLKKYLSDSTLRITSADRELLKDLSRVSIIDAEDASKTAYSKNKSGAEKRLNKLCDAGLLKRHIVNQPGKGCFNAYSFKDAKVAKVCGGEMVKIGRKRNALHEVITSKIYYAEGRPDSFKLESRFNRDDREMFKLSSPSAVNRMSALPDAMYVKNGEIVVCEADSGQYNKSQIKAKQSNWGGFKQVWGQPDKASARVTENAIVHRF